MVQCVGTYFTFDSTYTQQYPNRRTFVEGRISVNISEWSCRDYSTECVKTSTNRFLSLVFQMDDRIQSLLKPYVQKVRSKPEKQQHGEEIHKQNSSHASVQLSMLNNTFTQVLDYTSKMCFKAKFFKKVLPWCCDIGFSEHKMNIINSTVNHLLWISDLSNPNDPESNTSSKSTKHVSESVHREYRYGRFLVKTDIFDPENVRNGLSIFNNPQNCPNQPSHFLDIVCIC